MTMKSALVEKIVETEGLGDRGFLDVKGRIYTFLNPVSYLQAMAHQELFSGFDGIFADGSLLVAAIRIVYGKRVTRRSCDMTSIGRQLLEISSQTGRSIYYVASKQDEVEESVAMFKQSFPNVQIIGFRNGYFANEKEMDVEAQHIVQLNPDYLVVGMGAVKQEEFLMRLKNAGYHGVGLTCGGFIHQTAHKDIDYYPKWADRFNVRFLYRMWKEPYTIRRYLKATFLFPCCFIWERFGFHD